MKKCYLLLMLLALMCILLAACGCQHNWADATCDTPKTCSLCGATEGASLSHQWQDATCEAPKTCTRCNKTDGAALGHSFPAGSSDCENPKVCGNCGKTECAAQPHAWVDANCTDPKTCSVCQKTEGTALEHTWTEANCSTARTCSTCGTTDGAPLGHSWLAATCEAPKTCENCGETQGEAKSHSWQDATCIMPKTCSVCHATEGKANGHDWQEATSDAPKTCRTCGETDGNKLNVDPRFKTSACQFLFGEWKELVTEVTEVNGKEYTITYWVYYDFQNDGTVTIQMIIDDVDAFRATFEAMMIDMMYTAFAEMGLSKIQADNEFMKQYNMTIPQYCKLYADEYIRSMTETVQKLVYYVEKDVLYVAETWKSEFFGESFKVVDDEVHIDYADGSGTYVLMPMP